VAGIAYIVCSLIYCRNKAYVAGLSASLSNDFSLGVDGRK